MNHQAKMSPRVSLSIDDEPADSMDGCMAAGTGSLALLPGGHKKATRRVDGCMAVGRQASAD